MKKIASSERVEFTKRFAVEIFKFDDDKRVFYGWASVVEKDGVEVVDLEGDVWSPDQMEETAWQFNVESRVGDEMHDEIQVSECVASIPFTKDLQQALGIDLGLVGWLVGFRVSDDDSWDRVREFERPMLSIGGHGQRDPVIED